MTKFLSRLAYATRGATAIEYGLIAALIVIAAMGAIAATGDENEAMWFDKVSQKVGESMPAQN